MSSKPTAKNASNDGEVEKPIIMASGPQPLTDLSALMKNATKIGAPVDLGGRFDESSPPTRSGVSIRPQSHPVPIETVTSSLIPEHFKQAHRSAQELISISSVFTVGKAKQAIDISVDWFITNHAIAENAIVIMLPTVPVKIPMMTKGVVTIDGVDYKVMWMDLVVEFWCNRTGLRTQCVTFLRVN